MKLLILLSLGLSSPLLGSSWRYSVTLLHLGHFYIAVVDLQPLEDCAEAEESAFAIDAVTKHHNLQSMYKQETK